MDQPAIQVTIGGHHVCTPAWTMKHAVLSDANRLYFVVSGRASTVVDGQEQLLVAGKSYFLPARRMTQNLCTRRMRVDWLHYLPLDTRTEMLLSRIGRGVMLPAALVDRWGEVHRSLSEFFAAPTNALTWRVHAMVMDITAHLLEHHVPAAERAAVDAVLSRFGQTLAYMDAHYLENPPLDELARQAKVSAVYFHRRFKAQFGVTPFDYMLRKRMLLARRLLRESDAPSWQIGREAGYDNPYYFSRAYKQYFRVSPRQDRRREVRP